MHTSPSALNSMRVHNSASSTRSKMRGAANNESSHVLCIAMVFLPPINISDVYSSMALLLSPTYGTYCTTHTIFLSCCIQSSWLLKKSRHEATKQVQTGQDRHPSSRLPHTCEYNFDNPYDYTLHNTEQHHQNWLRRNNSKQFDTRKFTLITMTWSGCSPGPYRIELLDTMSSTTLLLEISFDLNVCGADKFIPSLFPKWL